MVVSLQTYKYLHFDTSFGLQLNRYSFTNAFYQTTGFLAHFTSTLFFSFLLLYLLFSFCLIEKIYQTLEEVFHQLSKHLKVRQKYLTVHGILKYPKNFKRHLSCIWEIMRPKLRVDFDAAIRKKC